MTKAEQARWKSQIQTHAMARCIARRAVEEEIRRRGDKVAHYSAKALIEHADKYIKEHGAEVLRELVMRRWERLCVPKTQTRT